MDTVSFAAMWFWMVGAMMAPSIAPMVLAAAALVRGRPWSVRALRLSAFVAPYALLWCAAGVVALLARAAIEERPLAAAALVGIAGAYQLGGLNARLLETCRSPVGFFLSFGPPRSVPSALVLGVRHAGFCIGCCGGLMLALTAAGALHPLWMIALGVLILLEKTYTYGVALARLAGVALVAAAVVLAVASF
jgi:predicted metal-binding membrane protein